MAEDNANGDSPQDKEGREESKEESRAGLSKILTITIVVIAVIAIIITAMILIRPSEEKELEQVTFKIEDLINSPEIVAINEKRIACLDNGAWISSACNAFVSGSLNNCNDTYVLSIDGSEDESLGRRICINYAVSLEAVSAKNPDKCLELEEGMKIMCAATVSRDSSQCDASNNPELCRKIASRLMDSIRSGDLGFCEEFADISPSFYDFCPLFFKEKTSLSCEEYSERCDDSFYLDYVKIRGNKEVCVMIKDSIKKNECLNA